MAKNKIRSKCPIAQSLDVWGDKWSLLIVRDLLGSKSCTYGDLQRSKEKIATNILASRLQMLEENGIITKSEHPDSKAKVLYRLTQKGIDLLPVMVEVQLWGEKHFDISDERRAILLEIKKNKDAYLAATTKELQKAIF